MRALASSPIAAWVAAALTAGTLSSQQTWPVTTHQELLNAIAAAAPGDVIQLAQNGVFQGFTLDKGLILRGPGRIGGNFPAGSDILLAVPAGQLAQLVDIGFVPTPTNPPFYPSQGHIGVSGNARFDHCTIQGSGASALDLTQAHVVVQGCTIVSYSNGSGIRARDSVVSIHDSTLTGSSGSYSRYYSSNAAPGISSSGSGSLHLSSTTVQGGHGWYAPPYGNWLPADGLVTSVPTWISDSSAQGGWSNGPNDAGGNGLVATSAMHARCSFLGGAGSPPGQPIVGTAVSDPTLLGGSASGPLLLGQQVLLSFLADQPGVVVGVLATFGVRGPILVPVVTQPLWLGDPTLLLAAGATSGTGGFQLVLPVPMDPALTNASCDLIGFRLGGAGLQLAPLLGGLLR